MATENVSHDHSRGDEALDDTKVTLRAFPDVGTAIEYGSHCANRAAEAIDAIAEVMAPGGVSPEPVDYAKYSLRQMATLREAINVASHAAIQRAVEDHGGSVKELAEAAGISHSTVYRRLEEAAKTPVSIPYEHIEGFAIREWRQKTLPFGDERPASDGVVARLGGDALTTIYGVPGAGKTNICRNLVLQAMRRGWPTTVVTTEKESYEFSEASVVSVLGTAVAELRSIIESGADARTSDFGGVTPHLVVIDGLQDFGGDSGGGSESFELCRLIAELVSVAEESRIRVVITVRSPQNAQADEQFPEELRADLTTRGIDVAEHTQLILGGTGGLLDISESKPMRTIRSMSHLNAVLRSPSYSAVQDILVRPWCADEDALRHWLSEVEGVRQAVARPRPLRWLNRRPGH